MVTATVSIYMPSCIPFYQHEEQQIPAFLQSSICSSSLITAMLFFLFNKQWYTHCRMLVQECHRKKEKLLDTVVKILILELLKIYYKNAITEFLLNFLWFQDKSPQEVIEAAKLKALTKQWAAIGKCVDFSIIEL